MAPGPRGPTPPGAFPVDPGADQTVRVLEFRDERLATGRFNFYVPGESTDWAVGVAPAAGTLGESRRAFLGLYDLRPWEGKPAFEGTRPKGWEQATPVRGRLVLRLQSDSGSRGAGTNLFGASLAADQDLYRFASLSLLISTWDSTNDQNVWATRNVRPADPVANPRLDIPQNQGWMGPNILPHLAGQAATSVDVTTWARGARFVGVWLWPFWAGVAAMPELPLIWETWDQAPARAGYDGAWPTTWGVCFVAPPITTVLPDPIPSASPNLAFRWGNLPGAGWYRLGVFNGGNADADFRWCRQFGGPPFVSEDFSVNSLAVQVMPEFVAGANSGTRRTWGATHHELFAGVQVVGETLGPLLVTLTGGPYG